LQCPVPAFNGKGSKWSYKHTKEKEKHDCHYNNVLDSLRVIVITQGLL
jgi:hypothetical protein